MYRSFSIDTPGNRLFKKVVNFKVIIIKLAIK